MCDSLNTSLTLREGRYVVKLPWRADGSVSLLQGNMAAAEGRLSSLSRGMDQDPVMRDRYDSVLQEMEDFGVIV